MSDYQRSEFEEVKQEFKRNMESKKWDCYDDGRNKSFCVIGDATVEISFKR